MKKKVCLIVILGLCLSILLVCESNAQVDQTRVDNGGNYQFYLPFISNNPRNGGWLDRITVVAVPSGESAVSQLENGELDVYADEIGDPLLARRVIDAPMLDYDYVHNSNYELTINPAGPLFNDGRLNPFNDPKIREALNWLIDRNYISQVMMSALAEPKWLPIAFVSADHSRMAEFVAQIEQAYSFNLNKAEDIITQEMQTLGAEKVDGIWQFAGQPVELIFLIRSEDQRKAIGDYIAFQLEVMGFTVDRQYKTNAEARVIWVGSDPYEGIWNLYTGGWVTGLSRDDGGNFAYFYTPEGYDSPLWRAYTPTAEFHDIADRLASMDFTSMAERNDLLGQVLWMAMQDSVHVWLVDLRTITPRRRDVSVASDLAHGISGAESWPYTLRRNELLGGTAVIAQPSIMVEPWNPVAGSSSVADQMVIQATGESALMPDPYTGLNTPLRIERAEVVVKENIPVTKTLDWIDLSYASEIQVPGDAWVDWDAANQKFITSAEKYTQTQTANIKTTVYYPSDLFRSVTWHDGSPLSMGDFVLRMILNFDRSKPESAVYDESVVPVMDAYLAHFKGLRILSMDPLIIETYDNEYQLDAELIVTGWFPWYDRGEGAWQSVSLGILGEINNQLAFSAEKASLKQVEWVNYIAEPSLTILANTLNQAVSENYIPYLPTMGQYVSESEAQLRWANYQTWYNTYRHFWIGTGLYYLSEVRATDKTIYLERNLSYPDNLYKWSTYTGVPIPVVRVDGPTIVTIGSTVTFTTTLSYNQQQYPNSEIDRVSFLLYDGLGKLVANGSASPVEDGLWQIDLTAEMTGLLVPGEGKLVVVVVSKVEVIPEYTTTIFTVIP